MPADSPGLHHVTSLVADAQDSVDFYTGVLGLRLVKHTVNQKDMLTRHLFYGNEAGEPGTVYTCFPYPNEVPARPGKPSVPAAMFAVPQGNLDFWRDRLDDHDISHETRERLDETALRFADPAGTTLELVAAESPVEPWAATVPDEHAIRGFHGVTTLPADPYATASTLETFGFALDAEDGDRVRYRAPGDRATVVDVLNRKAGYGREGVGSIQHVALRVPGRDDLMDYHDLLRERDLRVSRIRDRRYFESLYVRDPGGILWELATETPGYTLDEPRSDLGGSFVLPEFFADDRDLIESQLPDLET
ncbi:VOC family protein [Salarchaeum japonicum]|uniref:VOC family protein n=1 Tax=Salarchaeum japonicum TaxID=555573 RepID=UPI003C724FAE